MEHLEGTHDVTIALPDTTGLAEQLSTLLADAYEADLFAGSLVFSFHLQSKLDDVGIERSAQTPVGSNYDDFHGFDIANLHQGKTCCIGSPRQIGHGLVEFGGVRSERLHFLLGAAEFRCSDHVHGLSDLSRLLDARDLQFYFL